MVMIFPLRTSVDVRLFLNQTQLPRAQCSAAVTCCTGPFCGITFALAPVSCIFQNHLKGTTFGFPSPLKTDPYSRITLNLVSSELYACIRRKTDTEVDELHQVQQLMRFSAS